MKKNKGKRKFNNLKKTLKGFIKDEDGFVTKNSIIKLGLGTITALGVISSMSNSFAGHTNHASHGNTNVVVQEWIAGTSCYKFGADHVSHPSHASHASY